MLSLNASKFVRNWVARRVDIIMCKVDEYPFASIGNFLIGCFKYVLNIFIFLGWIGSKQFVRSIRLYSEKELNFKLTSQGLFDKKNVIVFF